MENHDKNNIYLYENYKNLYMESFQRLATIVALINSGGIIAISTILAGSNSSRFYKLFNFLCISFYPLNVALLSFSLALLCCFSILFIDFVYISAEFSNIQESISKSSTFQSSDKTKVVLWQWRIGKALIMFMVIGFILALASVIPAAKSQC